jgi:hypothetical protein
MARIVNVVPNVVGIGTREVVEEVEAGKKREDE